MTKPNKITTETGISDLLDLIKTKLFSWEKIFAK